MLLLLTMPLSNFFCKRKPSPPIVTLLTVIVCTNHIVYLPRIQLQIDKIKQYKRVKTGRFRRRTFTPQYLDLVLQLKIPF